MENFREVRRIIAVARKQTTLPLTAKIRLGPKLDQGKLKDFCAMLEDEGIDLFDGTRTPQQGTFWQKTTLVLVCQDQGMADDSTSHQWRHLLQSGW